MDRALPTLAGNRITEVDAEGQDFTTQGATAAPTATAEPSVEGAGIEGSEPQGPATVDPGPVGPEDQLGEEGYAALVARITATQADMLADEPPVIDSGALILEDDAIILKVMQDRLRRACEFRRLFEDRWEVAHTNWMGYLRGDADVWQSRVFIPLLYEQVAAAHPNFMAAIFDSGHLFDVAPFEPGDEKQAEAVQGATEHFMRVRMPAEREISDWLKYALKYGTGILRTSWHLKVGNRRIQQKVTGPKLTTDGVVPDAELGTRLVNEQAAIEDRPDIESVDIWNAFLPPESTGDHRIEWYIERVETTIGAVVQKAELGAYGPAGKAAVASWLETKPQYDRTTSWHTANTRARAWALTGISSPFSSPIEEAPGKASPHSPVVVFEMWTDSELVVVSGDGTKVLAKVPNPYAHGKIPIVIHHLDRIEKCPWGLGCNDVIGGLVDQTNFNYNKANDAAQLALSPPIVARRSGTSLGQGQTSIAPGAILFAPDPSRDIKTLDIRNPMGDALNMEAHLVSHADKATGFNDLARGSAPSGANTATEFAGVQSQFRMRMSGHVRELRVSMSRLGNLIVSLIQQFVSTEMMIRIVGVQGLDYRQITNGDLAGQFDVVSTASFSKSNPTLMRSDIATIFPMLSVHPMVDQRDLIKRVAKAFEMDHPERLLLPEPRPYTDPMLENLVLDQGQAVEPSPEEWISGGVEAHIQAHVARLQALQADPAANPEAVKAYNDHLRATMMMQSQVMGNAGQGQGPGAPPTAGKKAPGGTDARREATKHGQAAGSDGPPGRAPGPGKAPNRRE